MYKAVASWCYLNLLLSVKCLYPQIVSLYISINPSAFLKNGNLSKTVYVVVLLPPKIDDARFCAGGSY